MMSNDVKNKLNFQKLVEQVLRGVDAGLKREIYYWYAYYVSPIFDLDLSKTRLYNRIDSCTNKRYMFYYFTPCIYNVYLLLDERNIKNGNAYIYSLLFLSWTG